MKELATSTPIVLFIHAFECNTSQDSLASVLMTTLQVEKNEYEPPNIHEFLRQQSEDSWF